MQYIPFDFPASAVFYRFASVKYLGMVGLSVGEKHFIQGGIAQDLRTDGRKRLHYRPISVEIGVIPQV